MRRTGTLLLILCLLMSCGTACSQESFEGRVEEMGEKVIDAAQNFMDEYEAKKEQEEEAAAEVAAAEERAAGEAPVASGVEVTGESVILTLDYQGREQVHSFQFTNGVLVDAHVYMLCESDQQKDNARAYFVQANAEEVRFEGIRTEDTMVTANYMEQALEQYRGLTMEELGALLAGEHGLTVKTAAAPADGE